MNTHNPIRRSEKNPKFITYDNLDKIGEIAVYYGFVPMKSPSVSKNDVAAAKDLLENEQPHDQNDYPGNLSFHAEEKVALIRTYNEQNMHTLPQPVMLYFKDPYRGSLKTDKYSRYADFEILGTSGSIAEATLIQTARAMLSEEGYANTAVEINSVGDKDSIARFVRELTSYYRKHINEMTPACRQLFKLDPFSLLSSTDPSCAELNASAPRAMDFLTESSRHHLEEVLEYLEALNIPYSINNGLIGNRAYCTETIFSIINMDAEATSAKGPRILAIGTRYNGLAKRLSMKRDVQGVGMSLLIKNTNGSLRKPVTKMKRPIASFVQLGIDSKLLSLDIIERLRQASIPLYLSLAKDRLGAQVSSVEKYHTPYVIVVGKKEAVDKTAIVRHTDTHSQDIVPLEDLPKYMKRVEASYGKS
jgi:histidyl-tRNA synthetase